MIVGYVITLVALIAGAPPERPPAEHPPTGFADWSGDGSKIVYSRMIDGRYQLHLLDLASETSRRLLTTTGNDISPSWSPDDGRILFVSDRDGNQEIYELELESGREERLTNTEGHEMAPDYDPRGGLIFGYSEETERENLGRSSRLFHRDAEGTVTPLFQGGVQHYPVWSPDGKRLAFSGTLPESEGISWDHTYGIWLWTPGSKPLRVAADRVGYNSGWAPDGRSLLFVSPTAAVATIYRSTLDGEPSTRLTRNEIPWFEPRVSPDGEHILVRIGRGQAHRGVGLLDRKGKLLKIVAPRPTPASVRSTDETTR